MFGFKHQFRIERDLLDQICDEAGWQQVVIYPDKPWRHIAICNPKGRWFVIADCCVGNYSPAFRIFYSDKTFRSCIDKTPLDSRIEPWCDCCSDTPRVDVRKAAEARPNIVTSSEQMPPAEQGKRERYVEYLRAFRAGELEVKWQRVVPKPPKWRNLKPR